MPLDSRRRFLPHLLVGILRTRVAVQELDWPVDALEGESVDRRAARHVDDPFHAALRGPLEHANALKVEIEPQTIADSLERRGDRDVAGVRLNFVGQPIGEGQVLLALLGARASISSQ